MGNGVHENLGNISPRGAKTAICIISGNDENINVNISILVFNASMLRIQLQLAFDTSYLWSDTVVPTIPLRDYFFVKWRKNYEK